MDYTIRQTVESHQLSQIVNINDTRGCIVTLFNGTCDVHNDYCKSPFQIYDAVNMLEQFYENDFTKKLQKYKIKQHTDILLPA